MAKSQASDTQIPEFSASQNPGEHKVQHSYWGYAWTGVNFQRRMEELEKGLEDVKGRVGMLEAGERDKNDREREEEDNIKAGRNLRAMRAKRTE